MMRYCGALVPFLFCCCHQPAGEIFPVIEPPMVWPGGGEVARIKLVGTISGSHDLKAARSGSEKFKSALRGPRPPLKFTGPHAVACRPPGLLAIADSGGRAVHIIDLQERTHLATFGWQEEQFGSPVGVAWAGERLFVTDAQLHQVYELNQNGQVLRRFGEDQLIRPVGITYVPQRRQLYVVDGGAHAVQVYDLDGRPVRTIGLRGLEPGRFNYPSHIAYDGEGLLAVTDTGNFRVQLLDLDGACVRVYGQKGDGAGDFALPKGVAFDSERHLYVVDAQFENIQIFDPQGRLLLAVGQEGGGLGEFSLPAGLAIDDQDRIWVADSANRRVQVFQYLKNAVSSQLSTISLRMEN